jgi:diguanylate cyclase (GGDEF)-like protein/PAS domain S-box-containing protein
MSAPQPPFLSLSGTVHEASHSGRVRAIHASTGVGVVVEVLAVVAVAAALYGSANASLLMAWSGFMAVTVFVRLALSLHGRNSTGEQVSLGASENVVAAVWCSAGVGWGVATVLFFPLDGALREGLILLVVCAMVVLSLEVLHSSRRATLAYAMPATLISAVSLLATGDPMRVALALLLAVFLGLILYGLTRRHRAFETAIVTRMENDRLLGELASTERSLRASIEEERLILEVAHVGIAIVRDDRFVRCNRRMEEIFGVSPNGLDGLSTQVIYPGDAEWRESLALIYAHLANAGSHTEERLFRTRDGASVWCRYQGKIVDRASPAQGSIWVFEDLTEPKRAAELVSASAAQAAAVTAKTSDTNARLADALACVPDAFALFDTDDRLVLCNEEYRKAMPGNPTEATLVGKTFEELLLSGIEATLPIAYKRDPAGWVKLVMTKHRSPDADDLIYEEGDGRWWQVRERRTADGGVVTMKTDISHLKRSEEEVRHLANHDPLTGLPNRRLLDDRLTQALSMAQRSGHGVGVMVIDLDRFKVINDTHGHELGDRVLQAVAKRLRSTVRRVDTVARLGGDEFIVVLPELRRATDAMRVASKIQQQLAKPIAIARHSFTVGASIGIGVYPSDGIDPEALLRAADAAMYRAKSTGTGGVEFVTNLPHQQELALH